MNRLCSAVGKTQRDVWSWLIRRSRWTQAVSRRSSSAASSGGRPSARAWAAGSRFVSSMYRWIGSLMRLTAANRSRGAAGSTGPLVIGRPTLRGAVHPDRVPRAVARADAHPQRVRPG